MSIRSFAICGVCAALALPAVALCQDLNDYSPLEARNLRSLSLPFLRLDPRPWVLDKHEQTLTIGFDAANDVRKVFVNGVQRVYEDYEEDILRARYRQGLGKGMDFTLDGSIISRGGGFMDPIIDWWHKHVVRLTTDRDGGEYGQTLIEVPGSGPYRDALGLGDLSGALTKALTPQLMGTVAVKLPTGNAHQILGSGNVDGAVDLQYKMKCGERWALQFQAGVVGQGKSTELKSTRGINPQGAIVLMHKANRLDNYLLQWQTEESGIVTGVGGSDAPHRIVTVAYQRRLSNGRMFELYFTEDGSATRLPPEVVNIGPDVTIGMRYTMKF